MNKPLLDALAGGKRPRPPYWLMRQAGRYLPEYRALRDRKPSFLALCYEPALAAEATLQPLRRFGMDGAILFSDILVVADALGVRVDFVEGEGPVLDPVRGPGAVARLAPERVVERLAPVYEAVRLVRAALPESTALIGFAGAPWTVAAYMVQGCACREFPAAKGWAYRKPEEFGALIDKLTAATVEHLSAQVAAGAEVVQLFDSWAGVLSADAFERWCVAPTAAIVRALKARHPGLPVIGFPRGAGTGYERYTTASGVDAVGLDAAVPLEWAAERIQPYRVVQGNLDPYLLVVGGRAMRKAVDRLLHVFRSGPYVFNLGHGIVPETPVEHVAELSRLIRGDG